MILNCLIVAIYMIGHVASHGQMINPVPRNKGIYGHGCFVAWDKHYLQGFRCNHVCGNDWTDETGEIDPRYENTGPITATYKMGQIIEIKFNQTGHRGPTRFRLCKLSKSTDRVNQECLDQNLLEITRIVSSVSMKLQDKYTLYKDHTVQDATIQVKLPDGLSCDNCVLQWEWITLPAEYSAGTGCFYASGAKAPIEYCMNQIYKNCADIKIEQDPARPNQLYIPNTVHNVYPKTRVHEPVFWYQDWPHMRKDSNGSFLIPFENDSLKFKGVGHYGLVCFATGKWIVSQYVASEAFGKLCRENCMSPDKKCPDDCLCRWFEFDPLHSAPTNPLPSLPAHQHTYGQCGGGNWNGPKYCGSFSKCVYVNQYYSQCQPL